MVDELAISSLWILNWDQTLRAKKRSKYTVSFITGKTGLENMVRPHMSFLNLDLELHLSLLFAGREAWGHQALLSLLITCWGQGPGGALDLFIKLRVRSGGEMLLKKKWQNLVRI